MFKQSDVDWPTVLKVLSGGALLGAGAGAGTSLLRHLNVLSDKAKKKKTSDDNTLYVNIPPKQASSRHDANNAATFAASGIAGLAGTYAAYNAVRGMYSKIRKQQLQKELENAQQTYISDLGQQSKIASGQFSGLTTLVGSGYLLALLTALGSGVVTNKILQKQFPPIKNPDRNKPKKIVIRSEPTEIPKTDAISPDANEGILRQNLGNPKVASASGLADLVCAVAQGRGPEIKELLTEYAGTPGAVNFMFDTVKGASLVKTSALNKNLAITWLMTDPILSTVVEPLSAAEYYGWVPHCKVASFIDPEWQDDLVALTEGVVQETRRAMYAPLIDAMPEGLRKMASSLGPLRSPIMQKIVVADTLNRLLLGNQSHQNEAGTSANVSDDSAANAVPGFEANRPTIEAEGTEANKFLNSNKDVVDDALSRVGNNIGNNIGNGKGESGLGTQAAQMQ